jgi:hypothetical protein
MRQGRRVFLKNLQKNREEGAEDRKGGDALPVIDFGIKTPNKERACELEDRNRIISRSFSKRVRKNASWLIRVSR